MKFAFQIASRVIQGVAVAVLWWLGYALDMPEGKDGLVGFVIDESKTNAPSLVVWSGIALVLAQGGILLLKKPPKERRILDKLISDALEKFRSTVFPNIPGTEPLDNNRVSVFNYCSSKWVITPWRSIFWPWGLGRSPYSGWLAVTHRSGHQTQFKTTTFLVPDDAPKAEGVAGRAWRSESARRVSELPNINGTQYVGVLKAWAFRVMKRLGLTNPKITRYEESKLQVAIYAESTGMTPSQVWKRIKAGKRNPVSILAMPLETVDNSRWGVLVMDSSNGWDCLDSESKKFRIAFQALQKTLTNCGVSERT